MDCIHPESKVYCERKDGCRDCDEADSPVTSLDFIIIRKTLEHEISSKQKSVDRLVRLNELDAAAREDAVREGLSWALFVLSQNGI